MSVYVKKKEERIDNTVSCCKVSTSVLVKANII